MKKASLYLSILALTLMVLSLTACGGQNDPGKTTAQTPASTTQQSGTNSTQTPDTQATSPADNANPCTVTWLYNADFSTEPLENCSGTLLPIHAQLPLDLKAMDAQLAPYYYVTLQENVTVDSIEELFSLDISAKGVTSLIEIRKELWPRMEGLPKEIWLDYNLNHEGDFTVSQCLQNNWWSMSLNDRDDNISLFLDVEGSIKIGYRAHHQDINAILAKFGTPHRIYPGTRLDLEGLENMRAGTMEWEKIKKGLPYHLIWIFPEFVIEVSMSDIVWENAAGSESERYTSQVRIERVYYCPRALWDDRRNPTDNYLDPYQKWGK